MLLMQTHEPWPITGVRSRLPSFGTACFPAAFGKVAGEYSGVWSMSIHTQASRCAAIVFCALVNADPVSAATIETFASVDWENSAEVDSDVDGPVGSGTLTSSASAGGGVAEASIDTDAIAGLRVEGASAGGSVISELAAGAVWMDTVSNSSSSAQRYFAQISIPTISLFISDGVAAPTQASVASFTVSLEVDGNVVFSSDTRLSSGNGFAGATAAVLDVIGTDLGGVVSIVGQQTRVDFAPFSANVDLGTFAPNELFNVVYRVQVGMQIPGLEVFADASLGDPLNLQGQPITFSSTPVPLPGAAWLLLSGLAMIRRRPQLQAHA